MSSFKKVKEYIMDLGLEIDKEIPEDEILIIQDESQGLKNLIIDCESPILIIEQFILEIKNENMEIFKRLLQMNRELVHGAFVLEESGSKLLFRDTLQLENLDFNEIKASINALSLGLAENASELIQFSK